MIFQDPLTGAAPVLHGRRPDRRDLPAAHTASPSARRSERAIDMLGQVGIPNPKRGSTTTRTSSPAACGSAR